MASSPCSLCGEKVTILQPIVWLLWNGKQQPFHQTCVVQRLERVADLEEKIALLAEEAADRAWLMPAGGDE